MFADCINTASIFAIITARGHHPNTLKTAVKLMIQQEYAPSGGKKIDKVLFLENLNKFVQITKKQIEGDPIDYYLSMCEFHPVSYEDKSAPRPDNISKAATPEQAKVKALSGFINNVKSLAKNLRNIRQLRGRLRGTRLDITFTDDDKKNIEKSIVDNTLPNSNSVSNNALDNRVSDGVNNITTSNSNDKMVSKKRGRPKKIQTEQSSPN